MDSETTFANDEILPALPLPKLKDTLSRYLQSVEPHVTEKEFINTWRKASLMKVYSY